MTPHLITADTMHHCPPDLRCFARPGDLILLSVCPHPRYISTAHLLCTRDGQEPYAYTLDLIHGFISRHTWWRDQHSLVVGRHAYLGSAHAIKESQDVGDRKREVLSTITIYGAEDGDGLVRNEKIEALCFALGVDIGVDGHNVVDYFDNGSQVIVESMNEQHGQDSDHYDR